MNPIGYAQREKRARVRMARVRYRSGATALVPDTSRPAHGVHRVNPEGNLAYMVRTMARPRASFILTEAERDRIEQDAEGWRRNQGDAAFQSDFLDWRAAVDKYAKAKGLGRVTWTIEDRPMDRSHIFRWSTQ